MASRELTHPAARLLAGATSSARSLDKVVTLLPRLLPGCGAATATRWRDGKAIEMAASERSVAGVLASQLERGSGPVIDAVRSGHVWCADTRQVNRWPEFRTDALRAGIRSFFTLAHRSGATVVTVSVYGVKPNSLELDTAALALLLTASGTVLDAAGAGAAPGGGSRPARPRSPAASAQHEATQLLVRALRTTEQEASDILLVTSRECRMDTDNVAQWLVAEHARAVARIRDSARKALPQQPAPARPDTRLLAAVMEQSVRLRQQLAHSASSIAQTEARLADTLDRSAEHLPQHARKLAANASAARQYSRKVGQLALDFSQDHGRAPRQHA